MFKNLFIKKKLKIQNPEKGVTILNSMAYAIAVSSYKSFSNEFPELVEIYRENLLKDYDIIVKIAGIGIALKQLPNYYNTNLVSHYRQLILNELDDSEMNLINDFELHYDELIEDHFIMNYKDFIPHIGSWIFVHIADLRKLNNVLDRLCENEKLHSTMGIYLNENFYEYWELKF